jgi:hypothetical protein
MPRRAKASTKAQPPPADPLVFSAAKWASLVEAFDWAEGALGSSYLAAGDLTEHFRSGRLPMAMRRRVDGVNTFERLEPSQRLQVGEPDENGDVRVWGLTAEIASSLPHFFVARESLEQLYSPGAALEPASGASAEASNAPPRWKPGKRPIKDWPTVVARELIRRAYAGEKKPTPAAMVRFCEKTIKHSPDPSDMQKLLKELL